MIKKIFFILFLLLTLIISELIYFYFLLNSNKNKDNKFKYNLKNNNINKDTITDEFYFPTWMPTHKPKMTACEMMDSWNFVWLKNLTEKVHIVTYQKGIIKNIYLNKNNNENEYEINNNKKDFQLMIDNKSIEYKLIITLESLFDKKVTNTFRYTAYDISKLKISSINLSNSTKKKINLDDLKIGDKIYLIIKANIYPGGGNIIEGEIIKEL